MKIDFISDLSGNMDEGMKIIAQELAKSLGNISTFETRVISSTSAFSNIKDTDIIHYIGGPSYRSILFCFVSKLKNRNVKTILSFTNPVWGKAANILIRIFPPDHITVSSKKWETWAKKNFSKYTFLNLSGVDTDKFKPVNEKRKSELRKIHNIPVDSEVLLHVGHLKVDRNISSLKQLQQNNSIQVVIVGSTTTTHSDDIMNDLINEGVIIVKEYLPKIEEFYQLSDCYIFPTIDENAAVQVPLSVLEAMAVNIPVLSTKYGGLTSLFPPDNSVRYYEPGDHPNYLNEIKEAMNTQKNNREHVINHAWRNIASKLGSLYMKMHNGEVTVE